MTRKLTRVLCLGAALLLAASTTFADVHVTMRDGRVSIVAKDATLREILAEWARVGHTTIVNGEKIPGGPITVELTDVAEQQALDLLFRPLSGYIAAPRLEPAAGMSVFDRIVVMPTLAAVRTSTSAAPPAPQPQIVVQPVEGAIVESAPAASIEIPEISVEPPIDAMSPRTINADGVQRNGGMTGGFQRGQPGFGPAGLRGPGPAAGVAVPGTMPQPRPLDGGGIALPPPTPGQEIAPQPSQFRRRGGAD